MKTSHTKTKSLHTHTHTQRERERERERDTHTHTYTHTYIHTLLNSRCVSARDENDDRGHSNISHSDVCYIVLQGSNKCTITALK